MTRATKNKQRAPNGARSLLQMIGKFNTILWDVDNTLIDFEASEDISLRECMELQDITATPEQIEAYKKINTRWWQQLELGQVEKADLYPGRFAEWFQTMGMTGKDPVKMNLDYQEALGRNPVLFEDSVPVLKQLSALCRQYAVTNGSVVAQENKLRISGLGKLFDDVFISEQIGIPKPDKAYFDACAARIPDYDPARTVIIGDSLTSDITGGNNAGIACIWFNPKGQEKPTNLRIDAEVRSLSEIPEVLKRL